jgi:hypothetical protein
MEASDILKLRLYNTGLSQSPFNNPIDAVSRLGAVQAQDFAAAKWSLGLRVRNSTNRTIENAFDEGIIQRVHVLRPTWHFVPPMDVRWMQALTAPRIKAVLEPYNRKLELDDALFARSNDVIVKRLKGHRYLTRQELKTVLAGIGIETDVQRLAHIIMWAELDSLICSGPKRGKQFTYALQKERIANPRELGREQALAELAYKYFSSHGPAQLEDFAWWSGLTTREANVALDSIGSKLNQETIGTKKYWFHNRRGAKIRQPPLALLLSVYDEYTIAYKDRSDISEARDIERMISMGNALTAVIILNGKVAGTWKKTVKKNNVDIKISPFRKLDESEKEAIKAEAARYGKFFGVSTVLVE